MSTRNLGPHLPQPSEKVLEEWRQIARANSPVARCWTRRAAERRAREWNHGSLTMAAVVVRR